MALYKFEAISKNGGNIRGELEAKSRDEVERLLITRSDIAWISKIQTVRVTRKGDPSLPPSLKITELETLSYQIGVLLKAGMNVNQIFDTLAKSLPSPSLVSVVKTLHERIRKGSPFHQAFEEMHGLFPRFYISMVHAGEVSGALDLTFIKLSQFYRKLKTIREKIVQALIYPIFVMTAGLGVFVMAEVIVLPKFQVLYEQMRVPLPLQTRFLIELSHFIRSHAILLVLFFIAAGALTWLAFHREKPRAFIDHWILNLPVFGTIFKNYESLIFSFGLGNLASSGILITQALGLCAETASNQTFKKRIRQIEEGIRKGKNLSQMLRETHLLTPIAEQLLVTGDSTGQIGELASEASGYLETELVVSIEKLVASFEPTLLVLVGAGIGFLLFSLYVPIFGAAKHIIH